MMTLRFDFEEHLDLTLLEKFWKIHNNLNINVALKNRYLVMMSLSFNTELLQYDFSIHFSQQEKEGDWKILPCTHPKITALPFVKKMEKKYPRSLYNHEIRIHSNDKKDLEMLYKEIIFQIFKIDKISNFI